MLLLNENRDENPSQCKNMLYRPIKHRGTLSQVIHGSLLWSLCIFSHKTAKGPHN